MQIRPVTIRTDKTKLNAMPINPISYNELFITEAALKAQSMINENVDMKTLRPTIKLCQEKYLTKILGSGLYVDLQNKIYNGNHGLTGSTLLNENDIFLLNAYIQPMMVWLILQDAPTFITFKLMNKGVAVQSSDTSRPASLAEIQSFQNVARNNADWYTQRLMTYLIANQQLYPAYLVYKTYDDVIPDTRGYKSPIYLGNGYSNNRGTGFGNGGGCDDCDPLWYYR